MKIEDLKEGMIVVTKGGYVYIAHKVRRENNCVGIRPYGWAYFNEHIDDNFAIDSVYVALKPWGMVILYNSMSKANSCDRDSASILLLSDTSLFEKVYPKVRHLTREEAEKRIGFPFKIIGE